MRYRTTSELNLRSLPSTDARVIRVLGKGEVVDELGRSGEWRWVQTSAEPRGWVHGKFLAPTSSPPRLAASLARLRAEVDSAHPKRSKFFDGWIGDAAHRARKSEHNPDGDGVVRAIDITHDPAHGCDAGKLAAALVASQDYRILYVIWDRRIWRSYAKPGLPAWTPEVYRGENAHDHHCHVSVVESRGQYDNSAPWGIA